jgi:hypothetical protein
MGCCKDGLSTDSVSQVLGPQQAQCLAAESVVLGYIPAINLQSHSVLSSRAPPQSFSFKLEMSSLPLSHSPGGRLPPKQQKVQYCSSIQGSEDI